MNIHSPDWICDVTVEGKYLNNAGYVPGRCDCCREAACVLFRIKVDFDWSFFAAPSDSRIWLDYKVCGNGAVDLAGPPWRSKNYPSPGPREPLFPPWTKGVPTWVETGGMPPLGDPGKI